MKDEITRDQRLETREQSREEHQTPLAKATTSSSEVGEKIEGTEYRLDDIHLEEAKRIAEANTVKANCKLCYGRGWIGINPQNELLTCPKCVDNAKINFVWYCYLEQVNDYALNKRYEALIKRQKEIGNGVDNEQASK